MFVANDGDDNGQVYAMPMDGGDPKQVTHAKDGVDAYALSPDGKLIAYEIPDINPKQKEIDAHHDAFQVGDNDYLRRSATMNEHVWIVAASGGTPRRLTSGNWSVGLDGTGPLSWSADGKSWRSCAIRRRTSAIRSHRKSNSSTSRPARPVR